MVGHPVYTSVKYNIKYIKKRKRIETETLTK